MGYYDNDYNQNNHRQKGNGARGLIAGITGAILGGLLIIFAVPALSNLGILPSDLILSDNETTQGTKENAIPNNEPNEVINIDVNTAVTEAVEIASDAVVEVVNIQRASLFDQGSQAGTGSGVIYKIDNQYAYVVTNHHVVEGAAQLEVSLSNGTKLKADLMGSDPLMDLAVLRVSNDKVKISAGFGNSDLLKPGEPVIAIGNPLGNFPGTVTQGIVSAANRTIPVDIDQDGTPDWHAEVIQTDAAINPGNSGGALINIRGQVIGINSMKIAQQAVEGIGFAIPIKVAEPIINDLEKYGEVKRPFMGVEMVDLAQINGYHREQTLHLPDKIESGLVVMKVVPLSPANTAGIQEFDVIVELDGKTIETAAQLRKLLYTEKEIGENLKVTFYRDGKKQTATLKLTEQQD
jgi:serine protease Do